MPTFAFPPFHRPTFASPQGQQQQLGLARVLLRRPRIVLLDESTSGMDPVTAGAMQVMTQRVLSGCTVLQVAHR